jgi:DNA-binding transcriptional MerR regulator
MSTTARRATTTGYRLVQSDPPRRAQLVEIEVLAREAGVHPEVARRLVRLGLLEPSAGTAAAPRFPRDAAAQLARAVRLRRDLGIDYAGAVPASQLLTRIEELEARLRRYETTTNRPR